MTIHVSKATKKAIAKSVHRSEQKEALIEAWKEATIAWTVCASIHREYAKAKRDPFFKTRQRDFIKHENDARRAYTKARETSS